MLRFVRSDSVVSRLIADETLIVPVRRGVGDLASIYSLNPVASAIWEALAQPRTKEEIISVLQQEFDTVPESVSSEIDSFLAEMGSAGLVSSGAAA